MKKIKQGITIEMTLDEVMEFNAVVERDTEKDGVAHENVEFNGCPSCGGIFMSEMKFCPFCGQRVRFVKYDDIPL